MSASFQGNQKHHIPQIWSYRCVEPPGLDGESEVGPLEEQLAALTPVVSRIVLFNFYMFEFSTLSFSCWFLSSYHLQYESKHYMVSCKFTCVLGWPCQSEIYKDEHRYCAKQQRIDNY